ncbi:hypothetical protein [Pyrodictium delaneyi]|nr:hypothetical protein [Pyrodictium delaneyi]
MLISPTLIAWVVLPYYLLATGYEVLQVGALFTLMTVLGIPLQLLLGKVFTVRDLRLGLAAVDAMERAC